MSGVNPRLDLLQPYPFERLNDLLADITPNPASRFIALSLGEPKHAADDFLIDTYLDRANTLHGLATYPPTKGTPELRQAIAGFVNRRFNLGAAPVDAETQVLPVNGTREALFAVAQALINSDQGSTTLMPNPFYQIYEGAALLAGSQPVYVPCKAGNDFNPDFDVVTDEEWERCAMVYICSPGNPTGAVMSVEDMQALIRRSDEHDFVIVSDECYSEIYAKENEPPPGLLDAACQMGRHDYRNCIAFNSLSKRSNLPGLRSGYACGDAELIARYLLYRTYHGSAMSVHNQVLSAAAWNDEEHVVANRVRYREKYAAVMDVLSNTWPMTPPPASFYLWPKTPVDDETFTRKLMQEMNIKVVPGTYLSRESTAGNPGKNRVRMALVATLDECVEAAERLKQFIAQERYR